MPEGYGENDSIELLRRRLDGWIDCRKRIDRALAGYGEEISRELHADGCFSWATHVVHKIKALRARDSGDSTGEGGR